MVGTAWLNPPWSGKTANMKNSAACLRMRLTSQGSACLRAWYCNNLLDSAHFTGFKAHLDAVRVMGGTGQDLLHDPARPFPCSLILFLDDVYL
jgi:hypothetical protein